MDIEAIEHAMMFLTRDAVRRRFNLSVSEMEDIVGVEEAEQEMDVSGY